MLVINSVSVYVVACLWQALEEYLDYSDVMYVQYLSDWTFWILECPTSNKEPITMLCYLLVLRYSNIQLGTYLTSDLTLDRTTTE